MAVKKDLCAGRAISADAREFVDLEGRLKAVSMKFGKEKPNEEFRYIKCERKYDSRGVPFCNGATLTGDSNLLDCRCFYAD